MIRFGSCNKPIRHIFGLSVWHSLGVDSEQQRVVVRFWFGPRLFTIHKLLYIDSKVDSKADDWQQSQANNGERSSRPASAKRTLANIGEHPKNPSPTTGNSGMVNNYLISGRSTVAVAVRESFRESIDMIYHYTGILSLERGGVNCQALYPASVSSTSTEGGSRNNRQTAHTSPAAPEMLPTVAKIVYEASAGETSVKMIPASVITTRGANPTTRYWLRRKSWFFAPQ